MLGHKDRSIPAWCTGEVTEKICLGRNEMRKILLIIMLSIITVTSLLSQKIVVAVMQDPDFLDPHRAAASGTYEMMFNVFEGLLKPDPDGTVIL